MAADHDNLSLDRQQRLAELRRQLGGMGVGGVGHGSAVPVGRAACASRHSGVITLGGRDDLAEMGLAMGRLHEWLAPPAPHHPHAHDLHAPHGPHGPNARPPRVVLVQLAAAWWRRFGMDGGGGGGGGPPLATAHPSLVTGHSSLVTPLGMVVWIGEAVWPHPAAVYQVEPGLAAASVYVRATSVADRVWAADVCARAGVCVVVDMQGMDMAATRRLQLAGQGRGGDGAAGARRTAASPTAASPTAPTCTTAPTALILGTRPAEERASLSAAMTRWSVRPVLACGSDQAGGGEIASGAASGGRGCSAWALTLESAKGQGRQRGRTWIMEVQHASGVVRVVDAHGYGHGAASVAGSAGTIDDHDRGAA